VRRQSASGDRARHGNERQAVDRRRQPAVATVTTLASWARAIGKALDAEGVDSAALFDRAGIDRSQLDNPNARYPQEQLTELWRLAVEATGDEAFGLKVSRHVGATTFHALGFALTAASTLREVFEQIARYFRVVTNAADLTFEPVGDEYHLRLLLPTQGPQPAFESVDAFTAIWIRTCRGRVGRGYAPLRIRLQRPRPADTRRFDEAFRAPVEYGAPENLLAFDRATFERRLDDANPELARHNEQVLVRTLAQLEKSDIRARVRAALQEQLQFGEPSAEKVAAALHMSLRSLQRKLADAGTSYEAALNEIRCELARTYITDERYSVSEITYLLGFSDTSSFTRAFRRWFGCTPTQYRADKPRH
jgi:AraC-like DNA-binding protein